VRTRNSPGLAVTGHVRLGPAQAGQAIVLIALLILVLFGMLGLAVDSGRGYVDRRDQQTAVDAAALAAGDWYNNFPNATDLAGKDLAGSVAVYESDLRIYSGTPTPAYKFGTTGVPPNNNLRWDEWDYTFPGGYSLTIVATNTQFNGYQFQYTSSHNLPLAFIQIFGGSPTISIGATATSIVGNQRQTPAILTLNPTGCSLTMNGGGQLTVLGDVYADGQACVNGSLNEAGNCYGAAGSSCNIASYWCYNSTPGFTPYDPMTNGGVCKAGDVLGSPVVPAPSLPDPGYTAPSVGFYTTPQTFNLDNRGTYTEMFPGSYGAFHLSGASPAKCAFLDAGVYQWTGGYTSDATNSLLSNELKAPNEEYVSPANPLIGPGTTAQANPQFWNLNGAGCAGNFTVAVSVVAGYGIKHNNALGAGNWGVELTSVRYDQFLDNTNKFTPNPCLGYPGCRRESSPSACQVAATADIKDQVIDVSITQNAPGAEYYNVYLNPNGCDGNPNNFSFIDRFDAPGFSGGNPVGGYPTGAPGTLLSGGTGGWLCPVAGHTICAVSATTLLPNKLCYAQQRIQNCQPPDDELPPQCFSSCTPPPPTLSQENAAMQLQYPPNTGGDVANENYCQQAALAGTGDPNAPCANAKITPGAVQFYFTAGSCMTQNAQGATYVFSGEQYNWIIVYQVPGTPVTCNNTMDGGAGTQYIGTIYTPSSYWKITGGDRAPLAGQVIAWTVTVGGGAQVGVDFNPNYAPAPPAARLIN